MIDQIAIAITGVVAIWLSQSTKVSQSRWASVFGLIGQPFWMYATFQAEQWGIFGLTFLYTAAWFRGFHKHWISRWVSRGEDDH